MLYFAVIKAGGFDAVEAAENRGLQPVAIRCTKAAESVLLFDSADDAETQSKLAFWFCESIVAPFPPKSLLYYAPTTGETFFSMPDCMRTEKSRFRFGQRIANPGVE